MKSNICLAAILLAVAPSAGMVAYGYRWNRCGARDERLKWDHTTVRFRVHGASFPSTTLWRYALAEAADRWNQTPSNFRYNLTYDEPGVGRRNHENEIWWSEEFDESDPPAVTKWWNPRRVACEFKETDIIFNRTESYSVLLVGNKSDFWSYGGRMRPFQTTATHEFGHAQGLAHEERLYNIMGQDWTHIHANGPTATAYPGVDAVRGSIDTYGRLPAGSNQDLSITHFKRIGDDSEYSMHGRTGICDTAGVVLPNRGTAEPQFAVRPGQTVQVEFGYENIGVPSGRVIVNYYLSTDHVISTSDTILASRTVALEDTVVLNAESTRVTFTLPSWLAPGSRYWIGAVIDPLNVAAEVNEENNATYIGIEVLSPL